MTHNIEDNRKKFPGDYVNWNVADKEINSKHRWEIPSDYEKGGQYTKIQAWTWRSGHSVEIDQTPGGERFRIIHPNGSYIEMQHDGQTIYRSNNHNYEVVVGDKNLRVKGNVNIHVSGDANIKVDGDVTTESGGTTTSKIGGNWNVKVAGDINFNTNGNINFNK